MKILIDADGCPVVKETINIAKENKIEVVVFCDTSHIINNDYAKTVTVSKGADSVDFALVNQVSPGDIVVTQDYDSLRWCFQKAVNQSLKMELS